MKIRPEKTQAGNRDTDPKIRDVPGNTGRLATLYQGQSNKTRQHAENFYTSYPAHKNWNNKSVIPTLFNYYSALQSTFLVKQVATSLIHCYTSTKLALGDHTLVTWSRKINYHMIAYSLSNISAFLEDTVCVKGIECMLNVNFLDILLSSQQNLLSFHLIS